MPTDHHSPHRIFAPETAQLVSLRATLSRVRFHRRLRRTAATSALLAAVVAVVWLAIPTPVLRPGPSPVVNSTRIRSSPLTPEQKIVSSAAPGLYIRTPAEFPVAIRITTSPGTSVPRLDESEFRSLLAACDLYCIQLNGEAPEVRPLLPK
jgi:hypothetical protein